MYHMSRRFHLLNIVPIDVFILNTSAKQLMRSNYAKTLGVGPQCINDCNHCNYVYIVRVIDAGRMKVQEHVRFFSYCLDEFTSEIRWLCFNLQ